MPAPGPQARRIAVVKGVLFPEELAIWRACNEAGSHVTVIGTTADLFRKWPWTPNSVPDLDCIALRSLTPPLGPRMQLWLIYAGLTRTLKRINPDIIHVYAEPWGALVLQTLFARSAAALDAPVCVHSAETLYEQGSAPERLARKAIVRWVLPRIAGFASWSAKGLDAARRAGLANVPTAIVPGIVPDPAVVGPIAYVDRAVIRSELGLPPGMPIVAFIGRLVEEKGIKDLLMALERLEATGERPYLAVWGAGPLEGFVRRWLSLRADRGRFGGALPLGDVPRAFRACDAMVLPSRTTPTWEEQFGRVLPEAMLVGCPIIAYRSGAIPEALGPAGVLVDEGDVTGLSTAIGALMSDAQARDALATRAREHAKRFDPRVLAEELLRFWSEVLERQTRVAKDDIIG